MAEWLVLALAMVAACAVVLIVVVLNQRRVGDDDDPSETPDVIEYMTMMVGVVYAIVLGLAIAGVWESRGAAHDSARVEAQALHEVRERVAVWPAAERDLVRRDVDAYATYVVRTEWAHMVHQGELTDRGAELVARLRADVAGYHPADDYQGQAYQPLVDQVAAVDDARSVRADAAGPSMPSVVWFGLIAGALVAVGIIFTLQIRRSGRELLMAGLYSALIAFLLFLVWDFDAPFGRTVGDSVGAFADVLGIRV